jgi:hypothetical protein
MFIKKSHLNLFVVIKETFRWIKDAVEVNAFYYPALNQISRCLNILN